MVPLREALTSGLQQPICLELSVTYLLDKPYGDITRVFHVYTGKKLHSPDSIKTLTRLFTELTDEVSFIFGLTRGPPAEGNPILSSGLSIRLKHTPSNYQLKYTPNILHLNIKQFSNIGLERCLLDQVSPLTLLNVMSGGCTFYFMMC